MGQPAGWAPAEPLIDLGELTADELASDGEDGPVRPPRGLAFLLVVMLLGTGLVGDAARSLLRPVLTTSFIPTDFDLTGDVLYAFDGSLAPNRVAAYRLRDGQRLWRADSPTSTSFERVTRVGDRTLLVPNACIAQEPVKTTAVDTASGREVWRRTGVPEQSVAGGRLILMSRPGPTYGCGTGFARSDIGPSRWEVVEVATGAVVWSLDIPDFLRISFNSYGEEGARWVVFVARDGTVTTRNLFTGAVTGQVRLPELSFPAPPFEDASGPAAAPNLMVAGNQALVVHRVARRATDRPAVLQVTAYDLVTLERRWSVRTDAGPSDLRPGFDYLSLSDCEPMLCLRGPVWTVVLEPADGSERWRTSLSLIAIRGGRVLLADPRSNNGQGPGGLSIRDVRTGASSGDLTGWRILTGDPGRSSAPVLGFTVGDRTWFARLDLGRGRVLAVGSAPGWYGSCIAEPEYVACRQVDGSVRVWRAPSA